MPLDLPPVPPSDRQRRRAQRQRIARATGCRVGFKIAWGAAVTLSTMAGWLIDNCNPGGRIGPLWDALDALNDPRPVEVAPAPAGPPVGQSQETR